VDVDDERRDEDGRVVLRTVGEPGWAIRGLGDQNGDGKADVLWRHGPTGMLYLWTMNGKTIVTETYLATVDPTYVIVGTGDYNGDGRSDVPVAAPDKRRTLGLG